MAIITGLFRSNKPTQNPAQGVNIQSSIYGKPVPIIYGTTKVAGNLILYGNFNWTTISTGGGGKGGLFGGGSSGGTQYTYQAAFAFAVGEGPIQKFGTIWQGQAVFTLANLGFTAFLGTYPQSAWGTTVSWSVTDANGITTTGTSTPIDYNGIAYLACPNFSLGTNTAIPNLQYETFGIFSNSVSGQEDADPSLVLNDFLTNSHYGLGMSSSLIGDLTLWKNYCIATGFLVSPAYASQRTVTDMIDELMVATNSACFWSSGQFQVVPYGDQSIIKGALTTSMETDFVPNGTSIGTYNIIKVAEAATFAVDLGVIYTVGGTPLTVSTRPPSFFFSQLGGQGPFFFVTSGLATGTYYQDGHGNYYFADGDSGAQVTITYKWAAAASYNPNLTPLYSLTDDDFQATPQNNVGASATAGTAGPVLMTRKRKSDRINSVKIEYLDRNSSYNPAIAYAENQAEIDAYGKRTNGSKQLHLFCNATAANLSAQLQLRRELINNTYRFDLDQRYILLDPMDIIEITDANLGLNNQLVRVVEIDENDDGTLSFLCEDALLGTGQAPAFSFGQQQGQPLVNIESTPGPINTPVFFEPPFALNSDLEVWVGVSAPATSNWGGADCWVSTDGINYALAGRILGGARMGTLTGTLPSVSAALSGNTIDQLNTLAVDLTTSNGTLDTASQQQANNLASLCYAGGELLAYGTATLTATSKYNLTYLVRGAYGSTISSHAIGSNFIRLDNHGILQLPFTADRVGQTIYLKFLSFNQYGGGQISLGAAVPFTYVIQGTALAVPLANVTNLREVFVGNLAEISWTEITDFRSVLYEIRVGLTWLNGQSLGRVAHPPFRVFGDGTYWVAAFAQPEPNLIVYSATPQGIVVIGSNVTDNIFATRQEDPNFTGTYSGAVQKVGNTVQSNGTGGGTYTIPTGDRIIITYPFACAVIMKWTSIGQPLFNSLFAYKGVANLTSGSANVTGMILLNSNAVLNGGSTVTNISNTTSLSAGDPISGTGISTGSQVLAVLSTTSITMTLNATLGSTATPSTQSLTFYPDLQVGFVIQASTTLLSTAVTLTSLVSTDPSAAVMSTTALGTSTTSTVQVSVNFIGSSDLFGAGAVANTSVLPFLRTSQDGGTNWSTWQQWNAGYYKGNAFDAQMSIQTNDVNSVAVLETWSFIVDVPDRIDHYPSFAVSSLGSTLTFRPDASITSTAVGGATAAFNGGQNASTQVTVLAAPSTGNVGTIIASNISLNSCLLNSYSSLGVAVAAAANVVVEGY